MAVSVVSFSFSWCSTGGPGVHSAGCWLSLPHLISHFLWSPNSIGVPEGPLGRVWLSLPHPFYNSVSNCNCNSSGVQRPLRPDVALPTTSRLPPTPTLTGTGTRTSVLTELYNSPTSTWSPTRSLEWHDWSSSSGNNCHAVQRSLSSGASVYECIMGFTLSHFISQINPRDLFRLLAIGMCHFLPVHHFVMACLLGPKVKI